ncbi:MAG: ComEC/Rec2 family competence protein, partial [Planctomycetota bacterium]
AFVKTGTAHYLSVSGAHVGMLGSVVWLIGWLAGGSRRTCALWAMILITAYAFLAQPRPPIIRAALMADMFCLAVFFRRPARSANWLALAAIILLVVQPTQLFMPGFQLSFVAVAALVLFTPRFHESAGYLFYRLIGRDDPLLMPRMQMRINRPTTLQMLVNGTIRALGWWLAIAVSLWLVSSLVVACHFQRVALWGWLNTVLVLPFVWVTLVLGMTKTIVTLICPPLAGAIGFPLAWVAEVLIDLVKFLASLPGAGTATSAIPGWLAAAGLAVLGFWVIYPWLRISGHWVGLAVLAYLVVAGWQLAPTGRSDTLSLRVLSVGDGNCCVIRLPNSQTLIYDMGSRPPYDLERWTVGPLLAEERIYRIDAAILSHPNLDHYSGLPDLIERRRVGQVIAAPHFELLPNRSRGSRLLVSQIKQTGLPWRTITQGDRLNGTGQVAIEVLWPPPFDGFDISHPHDTSVVLRIEYAGKRVLLCGDIEELPQRELLASADLKADVLILPHHGGVDSTTGAFINAVDPQYCIRSSGQQNKNTRNGLLELVTDRTYYNTADNGAVCVEITPVELTVTPWRRR